uniref:Uncharacterized protein n=1 Tax=Arundo donax TaxID=35708 RepID=A0A0A9B832_ARUDO
MCGLPRFSFRVRKITITFFIYRITNLLIQEKRPNQG